jgi:maltooligosyltrehalose synthase
LTKLASELNLECYIASTQTTKLLGRIELPIKPKAILEYVDHLTPMDKASLEEMEGKALMLTSYREVIDLLRDMNTACREALRSSIAIDLRKLYIYLASTYFDVNSRKNCVFNYDYNFRFNFVLSSGES